MEYFYGRKGEGVMVFKGNEGGISHRQQSVKWECKKLTANQPRTKGGGGGKSGHNNITERHEEIR